MQNPYIRKIPEFLKKDYPRKSSLWLTIFFHDFWSKKFILVEQKQKKKVKNNDIIMNSNPTQFKTPQTPKMTKKENLKRVRENIIHYFCMDNIELGNYYLNQSSSQSEEYQAELVQPVWTFTQIVPGDLAPDLDKIKKEFEANHIEIKCSFPLYGEVGFITAKNKTRK